MPNSLYCAARFSNFEGILGFSVLSIILVGAGLIQITMFERARPAWPAKNKTENGEENRDGQWNSEKPKVVSKFLKRAARHNEFCSE